jgi:hypothetical protein
MEIVITKFSDNRKYNSLFIGSSHLKITLKQAKQLIKENNLQVTNKHTTYAGTHSIIYKY